MNCPKVSSEKGHCCNCGGDHNANYRGCPAYKEARTAAVQLDRKSRPTKPARDESPADSESESEAEDDMPQKKKRRRKPRNPANRQPRQPASVADLPVTQWPRATPRQKLEWQPTPATPPQQTEAPAADAAAEAAAPAQRSLQADCRSTPSLTRVDGVTFPQGRTVSPRRHLRTNCPTFQN
ncbi:hypothetical protein J6590_101798 [Homalodisca vitripennis]|nr:hypothetical protein J6590_101798 [Homalodisca vitripennis]